MNNESDTEQEQAGKGDCCRFRKCFKSILIELMCRDDWSFENVHAMDVTQGENKEDKNSIAYPVYV